MLFEADSRQNGAPYIVDAGDNDVCKGTGGTELCSSEMAVVLEWGLGDSVLTMDTVAAERESDTTSVQNHKTYEYSVTFPSYSDQHRTKSVTLHSVTSFNT